MTAPRGIVSGSGEPEDRAAMLIEKVARSMCIADGRDPDENAPAFENPDKETQMAGGDQYIGERKPRWNQYKKLAIRIIAAHVAIGR